MRSNSKSGSLSFKINDVNQGMIDNEIDIEKQFCMRFVMKSETIVELLDVE